jgi:hypothetical protein
MNRAERGSVGSLLRAVYAMDKADATAGGTGDNTAKVGTIIDRLLGCVAGETPVDTMQQYLSGVFVVPYVTTLSAGKTLSLTVSCEDGEEAALGDTADYTEGDFAKAVVASSVSGGTVKGVAVFPVALDNAGRYVRFTATPDLSATGTDTATIGPATLVLGGGFHVPTDKAMS